MKLTIHLETKVELLKNHNHEIPLVVDVDDPLHAETEYKKNN